MRCFKFTNAYRAADRATQFLIGDVIYASEDLPEEDVLLRTVLFRLFSRPSTWRALEMEVGLITRETVHSGALAASLERLSAKGPIYTGAFILCANKAYGYQRKYLNHLALVSHMFSNGSLPRAVSRARTLEAVYKALQSYPLLGPFMSYQLAIDINYSELTDFSEDEFTVPGPGAERGIRKVFPGVSRRDMPGVILGMTERQEAHATALGIELPTLFGRRLHAIDCQNLFCELDKYARVAFPEVRSNRARIKMRFTASNDLLRLVFPPKWGIDPGRVAGSLAV